MDPGGGHRQKEKDHDELYDRRPDPDSEPPVGGKCTAAWTASKAIIGRVPILYDSITGRRPAVAGRTVLMRVDRSLHPGLMIGCGEEPS